MSYVFAPAPVVTVPVEGAAERFPVHRIYCVGRNYVEHAQEMGHSGREAPFFFLKPADALLVVQPGETATLPYPDQTEDFHHEIELVVALAKGGRNIAAADALSHVYGYAVGLDMTRRDLQAQAKKQGRPWCAAKGFEHSAPIGPIKPAASVPGVESAAIWLQVNGQERQRSTVSKLIWNIAETIEHLSRLWTLAPGDLIYTGTPAGVGAVSPGEQLYGGVDGVGTLSLTVGER
ncbi:MAG: Fumarylpyruvate hydrolase [Paracidovorax wautersii]|uniref:Fumarylpyruvate hydrolase n=1 Tax=Paracidovorax wautersii TaxID=1177982 RepID=A0A7V8FQW0_9BURK|nr:MAG: Fumarylpyruvate hydrolase [Paracidovorax wautersii]